MALSRFMPYGASELLADQDERMAKATLAAMGLLALLLALAATVAAVLPTPHAVPMPTLLPTYQLLTPPNMNPPQPAPSFVRPAPHAATANPHAAPVPVPDAQVKLAPTLPQTSGDVGKAPAGPADPTQSAVPDACMCMGNTPPAPGTYVPVDDYPTLLKSADILYPDFARDAGVEGRVVVLLLVGKDGHVMDARVDPKHSVPMLDQAAMDCARTCVFTPARANGHPVMVWVARPFDFHLH